MISLQHANKLLTGPLLTSGGCLAFPAFLCDLRPLFIAKGQVGRSYRAISRNGRVLLASDLPLAELGGKTVQVRIQTWHRIILSEELPEPFGILLCVRQAIRAIPCYQARLVRKAQEQAALVLDVGGEQVLEFLR